MTRAVAQVPSDLVLSSTTESQEAIEHAVSENWKDPFIPAKEKEAAKAAEIEAAKAVLEIEETPDEKTERERVEAEAEHADETPDERAQRIADEAEPVKGNWSKRVNKLTARNARISEELRVEREAREKLESRLASLERGEKPDQRSDAETSAIADLPNKPKRIEFQDEGAYVEKLIQWTKANEDYKEGIQEQNEYVAQVLAAHGQRVDAAIDKYDDWEEVRKTTKNMIMPISVDFAIREMSNGPDVLYHFAKNPAVFERMSKMSPSQQVIEAGRISDRLAGANGANSGNGNGKSKKARVASPDPITPGGRRSVAGRETIEDLAAKSGVEGTEAYIRKRMADRRARLAH
jgi:hypothetical protein